MRAPLSAPPARRPFGIDDFLAHLPLFREVDRPALKQIARGTAVIDAPRGTVLFRRGDRCSGFHVIIFGRVKLALSSPDGGEKVIELMGPGQSFGEAVMFLDKPYAVTAETLADTKLVHVSREAVLAELERDPAFARRIIAGLSRRLHHLVADLEAATLQSGTQRVIGYLLSQEAAESDGGALVSLHANKRVIASRLNLSQEHFSRILHELAANGLIDVEGRGIRLLDAARLRAAGPPFP
jgi:CRP/FNR family transcriptional regulator, dissimilatory nitrate respiration regulator